MDRKEKTTKIFHTSVYFLILLSVCCLEVILLIKLSPGRFRFTINF